MEYSFEFIDPLEPRRFLDATLVNGVVLVEGTGLSDDIRVYRGPGPTDGPMYLVEIGPVNGERPTRLWMFPADQVKSVAVRAGAGDDVIDLSYGGSLPAPSPWGFGPVDVPTRVDGGLGGDTITGGTSRDFLYGSFGNDQISGGPGDDWIDGGWGNDFLQGNAGNDYVYGAAGNDTVGGDEGNDRLYGGTGDDFLGSLGFGPLPTEPGNDILVGGAGEDRLVGGEGKDALFGGTGRDHFSRADDESEMLDRTPDEPIDIVLPV
jgi:hypothetical protein